MPGLLTNDDYAYISYLVDTARQSIRKQHLQYQLQNELKNIGTLHKLDIFFSETTQFQFSNEALKQLARALQQANYDPHNEAYSPETNLYSHLLALKIYLKILNENHWRSSLLNIGICFKEMERYEIARIFLELIPNRTAAVIQVIGSLNAGMGVYHLYPRATNASPYLLNRIYQLEIEIRALSLGAIAELTGCDFNIFIQDLINNKNVENYIKNLNYLILIEAYFPNANLNFASCLLLASRLREINDSQEDKLSGLHLYSHLLALKIYTIELAKETNNREQLMQNIDNCLQEINRPAIFRDTQSMPQNSQYSYPMPLCSEALMHKIINLDAWLHVHFNLEFESYASQNPFHNSKSKKRHNPHPSPSYAQHSHHSPAPVRQRPPANSPVHGFHSFHRPATAPRPVPAPALTGAEPPLSKFTFPRRQ